METGRYFDIKYVFAIIFFNFIIHKSKGVANFHDQRCVCICERSWDPSGKKAVFINTTSADHCNCAHVVTPSCPTQPCAGCFCDLETRNTTTIKVVVFFILSVIALLLICMIFVVCVDPLIQRCLDSYLEGINNANKLKEISENKLKYGTTSTVEDKSVTDLPAKNYSLLKIVRKKHKKWAGVVDEQRKNIYSRHFMLN